jgi:hypothetical protein
MQYLILHTLEIIWALYHIFQQFKGHCIGYQNLEGTQYLHCAITPSLGHMIISLSRYPRNTLGSITYLLTHDEILHSPTRKPISSLGYFIIKHQGSTLLLNGYYSCLELLYKLAIAPCKVSLRYIGVHNIFFETWSIALPCQNLERMHYYDWATL